MVELKKVDLTIKKLKNCYSYLNKFMGFVCAGLLILYAVLTFDIDDKINLIVLKAYYILFAILIILCELGLTSILNLFGFMGNLYGKGVFVIFVGISMFKKEFELKTIIAIVFMLCGVGFIIMGCIPARIKHGLDGDKKSKKYQDKEKDKK